jgi:SSS family transporter
MSVFDWLELHWVAAVLLIVYIAALMYNALLGRRASSSIAGYYVGGRRLGGFTIGVSFFATFASTNSYIGHAGKGYAYGLPWLVMAFMLVLFTYLSWRWIGPRTRRMAAAFDALTLPDFLASRFLATSDHERHPLRIISGMVIVFSSILYLIAIFKGAGHLFALFFGISYEAAVMLALLIVVVYTSIGGFVSVVRTDVIQGGLMVVGAAMLFYFVTSAAGGVGAITELAQQPEREFLFDWNGGIPFVVLLGVALSGSLKLIVDPRQLSRFYALQDERAAKQGLWVAVIGLALVQMCLYPIGIYAHLLLDNVSDTDLIVPTLINNAAIFPMWAADFLFVAIVAAAMSSIDSVLLVAASTGYKNLLAPFVQAQRPLLWTRLLVVVLALVAALVALNPPGDIVQITIFSGSLYAVCFFPAVVLGLYWSKGHAQAVLGSMFAGTLVLLGWLALQLNTVLHEVFPALAVSILTYVTLSALRDAEVKQTREPQINSEFFK